MIIKHTFVEINGVAYKDYTFYSMSNLGWNNVSVLVDDNYYNKLRNPAAFPNVQSIDVPQDSSVYMAPWYPYAINDIRAHYTVKRNPNEADYVIISPYTKSVSYTNITKCVIIPSEKIIVGSCYKGGSFVSPEETAHFFKIDISQNDIITCYSLILNAITNADFYVKFLNDEITKPCRLCKYLNITNSLELNLDILHLVYQAGKSDDKNNFILQLNTLNQYNWREYTHTIRFVFQLLKCSYASAYSVISTHLLSQTKVIQNLISFNVSETKTEKDHNMQIAFIDSLLHIGDKKFTTLKQLLYKCSDIGLSPDNFMDIYDTMIKITPKAYEKKESNN